jgi:hypothetical protein
MASRRSPRDYDDIIERIARTQHGMVARRQLRAAGLPDSAIASRLRNRRLIRIHPGVFAVGHAALSTQARHVAAVLWGGDTSAISHLSAANLWEISRIPAPGVELTVVRSFRPVAGLLVHRSIALTRYEVTERDDLRRTTVSRTLQDLAASLTPWQITNMMNEARFRRRLRLETLHGIVVRSAHRAGNPCLAKALALHEGGSAGTKSFGEDTLLGGMLATRLPEPLVNVVVDAGRRAYELDFHWPAFRLNVEVDGSGHGVPHRTEADIQQDRDLTTAGWTVVRIPWEIVVDQTDRAVETVRSALAAAV